MFRLEKKNNAKWKNCWAHCALQKGARSTRSSAWRRGRVWASMWRKGPVWDREVMGQRYWSWRNPWRPCAPSSSASSRGPSSRSARLLCRRDSARTTCPPPDCARSRSLRINDMRLHRLISRKYFLNRYFLFNYNIIISYPERCYGRKGNPRALVSYR